MPRKKKPMTYEQRHKTLWQLFDTLVTRFIDILDNPPEDGLKPVHLAVIRSFLMDNGITVKNSGHRSLMGGLNQVQRDMQLPFYS